MVAAAAFAFANGLAFEMVVGSLVALDLAGLGTATATLVDCHFAGRTRAFVATARTNVTAL